MAKNSKKYIDGLVRRPISEGRTVGIDGIPLRKSGTKRPATKKTSKNPARKKITVKDLTRSDIAEEFVQPVGTLDFGEERADLLEQAEERLEAKGAAEKEDKKQAKKTRKAKKPKKKWSKKRKILTGIFGTLGGLIIVAAIVLFIWGDAIISKLTGGKSGFWDILGVVTGEQYVELKKDANGRTNVLLFGTSGYDMGGSGHDGAQLTDSIMAMSIDQEKNDVAMVSLPRDLMVGYTCTATGKINEVYWCNNMYDNDEQTGAEALMKEAGEVLGMDFQYYAHVNWGSLEQVVNIIGGIKITLDEDILDYYGTGYNYYANVEYEIDGEQALILSRARYGTTGGDFTRSTNQQKILIGIKNKLSEKKFSITDFISLANSLGDNLRTNFSINEMKTLANFSFDINSMRQISLLEPEPLLTTSTINAISYVVPSDGISNYTGIHNYLATKLSNDPGVQEEAIILVLNGTREDGLASAERDTLRKKGYANVDVDNAPDGEYQGKYIIYSFTDKPNTKAFLEKHYGVTVQTADTAPANISSDYDFVIILGF